MRKKVPQALTERARISLGFEGQRMIVLPPASLKKCRDIELTRGLYILSVGYFPKARHHYFQRPATLNQAILFYCVAGKGLVQIGKAKIEVAAGHVVIVPPKVYHSYSADTKDPWSIYWFHLGGNSIKDLNLIFLKGRNVLYVGVSELQINLFENIYKTFLKGYGASNLIYANFTLRYFLASFLSTDHNDLERVGRMNAVEVAIRFMQTNISSHLTLEQVARVCNLSVSYFSGMFRKGTGHSPMDYFHQLKIQKACHYLTFTNLRINEIGPLVGIEDSYYLSRLFRRHMGMSPRLYRKSTGTSRIEGSLS